jgi:hypothetical protein
MYIICIKGKCHEILTFKPQYLIIRSQIRAVHKICITARLSFFLVGIVDTSDKHRCCYLTVDTETHTSQNGFCFHELSLHSKTTLF